MKRMLLALSIAGALAPSLCKAQVMIDMTRITCADYLAMPLDETLNYAAWMSGYYSQRTGKTTSISTLSPPMSTTSRAGAHRTLRKP